MIDNLVRELTDNPRYERFAVRLALVREPGLRRSAPVLGSPESVAAAFRGMKALDRECLAVALLDVKNRLAGVHAVHIGSSRQSLVDPVDVFKAAILANASAIVVVHNHPSGDPTPSQEDIQTTRRLQRAGEVLGIHVLDHIVVAEDGFVSLRERGLLP